MASFLLPMKHCLYHYLLLLICLLFSFNCLNKFVLLYICIALIEIQKCLECLSVLLINIKSPTEFWLRNHMKHSFLSHNCGKLCMWVYPDELYHTSLRVLLIDFLRCRTSLCSFSIRFALLTYLPLLFKDSFWHRYWSTNICHILLVNIFSTRINLNFRIGKNTIWNKTSQWMPVTGFTSKAR